MCNRIKSTLTRVVLMLAVCGLVFVIGCGASQEQQKMSQFLMEYDKAVEEFSHADSSHKAEVAEKVDSYKAQWGNMKMEYAEELSPHDLNKFDDEYQAITRKYADLADHS